MIGILYQASQEIRGITREDALEKLAATCTRAQVAVCVRCRYYLRAD